MTRKYIKRDNTINTESKPEEINRESTEQIRTRVSREQETWDNIDIHASMDEIGENEGPLPYIKPRPGFVQRWIRTKIGGEDDPENISKSSNQHWRRRDPSTIPVGFSAPTIYVGGIGNAIGISGMILMERPVEINDKYKSRVIDRTKAQMRSVEESLYNVHSVGDGFNTPKSVGSSTSVTTGEMPVDD